MNSAVEEETPVVAQAQSKLEFKLHKPHENSIVNMLDSLKGQEEGLFKILKGQVDIRISKIVR